MARALSDSYRKFQIGTPLIVTPDSDLLASLARQ